MAKIISAYRQLGGIQIHEDNEDGSMTSRYVEEGSDGWLHAVAALPAEDMPPAAMPPASLAAVKAASVQGLNRACGQIRSQYFTVIPGQDMIYLAKESEARAYLAERPEILENYPMISAEVGITAQTAYQLAQMWLNMDAQWKFIAARIEGIRLGTINAIAAAADGAAVDAAMHAGLRDLVVFQSGGISE